MLLLLIILIFLSNVLCIPINCSISKMYKCSLDPQCIHFQFDYMSQTCIDCSSLISQGCAYINNSICSTYTSFQNKCIDCSTAENNTCTYSFLSGCADYGFDGSSKCYNCSAAKKQQCTYSQVTGCFAYQYDRASFQCFNCNMKTTAWTKTQCQACFFSQGLTQASPDGTKCISPTISVPQYSPSFSHTLFLLASILALYI